MRKQWILSAFVMAAISTTAFAQEVLMTINGKEITKSEFEYIYHKNNKQQVEIGGIDEYMPLFVNYKLKVDAAEKAGIDTTAAFVSELEGYRKELAKPYLTDRETEMALLQEAYNNYTKNVEVSHILITAGQVPTEESRAEALAKAQEVAAKIQAGEDFAALAAQYSEDPGSQSRGGYLGFVKGGRLIYPFEKVAFSMQPGEVSEPVETRFGYHIIKVHSVRPDQGERLCAHIFLMVPRDATPEVEAQIKAQADAIYSDLMAGADFAQMAREKSQDQANAMRGGELPWVSSGELVKELDNLVFSLEVGQIAAPVRTNFGYHIVRLNDSRGIRSFDEMRNELHQRISRDERASIARNVLMERLKAENNYKVDEVMVETAAALCGVAIDSTALAALTQQDMVLATYADKQITSADVAKSLKSRRLMPGHNPKNLILADIERKAEADLLEIETAALPEKYDDYRNLINEYRDGMLLFEISNREVWEKATTDLKGLEKFFKKNKKKYTWDRPRFKGYVVCCANEEVAKEAKKLIKKTKDSEVFATLNTTFNTDSVELVSLDKGLFVEGDNAYVDELAFAGAKAERDEKLPVVFISGKTLKAPETYLDVRGQVTADYQEYLEKLWVEKLNKAAKVVMNEDVLKTIK
ncbi:MAG: peptidylprolyl isomerase [Bacteroidaceae bacterium]|nr:peptidylprolyl isomerase [Bacteroidaceae bacterium]